MKSEPLRSQGLHHDMLLPLNRRSFLGHVSGLAALFAGTGPAGIGATERGADESDELLGFAPVPPSFADTIVVPTNYTCRVFFPWGTPVRPGAPEWTINSTSEDQRLQAGTHHDGMAFFPLDSVWDTEMNCLRGSSDHGYLAINHEYTDEGLLHADGVKDWSAEKVRKSKAAQGVSVIEIKRDASGWVVVSGRRLTGLDAMAFSGPATGHDLLRTTGAFDTHAERTGTGAEGTFANCSCGQTPWGTYLTCEENFQDYFARTETSTSDSPTSDKGAQRSEERAARYGLGRAELFVPGWRSAFGWDAHDPRFDLDRPEYRNNANRYGWVVELDPRDPTRTPTKRTALGRFRHENAATIIAPDGRAVVYMGDDARFEYLYKFVSDKRFEPELVGDDDTERRRKREHNWTILDSGTLYVAKFRATDTGEWIPLTMDNPAVGASQQFDSLAEILVYARKGADLVDATPLDRPEWVTVDQDPRTRLIRHVYVSLSNNNKRGALGSPQPDAVNPRANNVYGHIIRWQETNGDPTAMTFAWSAFLLGGDHKHPDPNYRGTVRSEAPLPAQDFGSPDGLCLDRRGVLWIQTDVNALFQHDGNYERLGNNQMLAADPATGKVRRFLTGPRNCEITGIAFTPDHRTMFVNIQHPGEPGNEFSDPASATVISAWPSGAKDGRPRSATLIIEHAQGMPIGSR